MGKEKKTYKNRVNEIFKTRLRKHIHMHISTNKCREKVEKVKKTESNGAKTNYIKERPTELKTKSKQVRNE